MRFRLNDREAMLEDAENARHALDALSPGLREKIGEERKAALPPEQRAALQVPEASRTPAEFKLAYEAENAIHVTYMDLVNRIETEAPDKLAEARRLATAAGRAELRARYIDNYREIVNYEYWQTRGQFEQTAEALKARQRVYEAQQLLQAGLVIKAQEKYEQALVNWRTVIDDFPSILEDPVTGDLLLDVIKEYKRLLSELDEPFPVDFPLWEIIERFDGDRLFADELEAHQLTTQGGADENGDTTTPEAGGKTGAETGAETGGDRPSKLDESGDDGAGDEETDGADRAESDDDENTDASNSVAGAGVAPN